MLTKVSHLLPATPSNGQPHGCLVEDIVEGFIHDKDHAGTIHIWALGFFVGFLGLLAYIASAAVSVSYVADCLAMQWTSPRFMVLSALACLVPSVLSNLRRANLSVCLVLNYFYTIGKHVHTLSKDNDAPVLCFSIRKYNHTRAKQLKAVKLKAAKRSGATSS
ncbi:hypothetical protein SPRG_07254 [Saprolegnia parasitica CBS 223.65]|uniref:Transmembrane protein n=1 Tax=Saprolegnia parasitica (strain CBS 223.65) TaxID=695850 RepID=A0A067CMC2_SAPPC|nr:hypothetical protein SPRG_07254 [Saprolegnia parasitica CBS 223.65]KDO27977.1 hypothetical protein SPRG_07254 [Saprolegnia parasitica CBS 223.65]|eukprot:XP_012201426.1 hypothetical protein SPRG_07254 [Saprolegnia parasitica CBS 223.65]